VRLVGFEPGGDGIATGRHGATLSEGSPGALHGALSYLLQDEDGQTAESYSISAGLDYPGVGPEHALLKDIGRATYEPVTDAEAMDLRAALPPEGTSRHRVRARRGRRAPRSRALGPDAIVLVNLSGRRQGRRHRGEVVQPVKGRSVVEEIFREDPGGGPCRADRNPDQTVDASVELLTAMVGLRPGQVGVAYPTPC
jgi:hypothetical protein